MNGLRLIATGGALPGRTVTNEDLSRMVDTSDEWIATRTGIRARHWCTDGENAATLAVAAAKQALQRSGLAPADIGCCVCATLSAPDATPSVACQVQAALGLPENRPALDVNAACSGFLYGLHVADAFFKSGIYKNALVIGAESLSKIVDWTDRGTCVLFGDGAGAAFLTASEEGGILSQSVGSNGEKWEVLSCPKGGYLQMNGQEVFKFAVRTVPLCVEDALEKAGMKADDVNLFLLHQANVRILQSVAKRLKQPEEKFPMNMNECGNTSAASLPILMAQLDQQGRFHRGNKVVLSGFGAGLTWGACVIEW